MQKRVLVYGATGVQGGPVVSQLLKAGFTVRLLVRDRHKAEFWQQAGAELAFGDLGDHPSLEKANRDVDRVFLQLPLEFTETVFEYGRNAIEAAQEAGVELLVFNTSVLVPEAKTGVKALDLKHDVECYLRESGLPYIILRPTFYMENLAAPWSIPSIMQQGTVAYPMPSDFCASWISVEDMAAYVVQALKNPELADSVFNIGGPEVLAAEDIAKKFAHALNRQIDYYPIPLNQFEEQINAVIGEPVGTEITALYRWFVTQPQSPAALNLDSVLQKLPVQLTPMKDWIHKKDCFAA
ncbi:putative NAD-dependent epimerase [Halomicronema hongdechloris C2206]|uniref:NAD-dependent epimerase n=1 Tax=Halomicronema hongdechloris C2206 TaxID=1641165 RepID=A0A1Z3HMT3_9CYAN|nr:NmrA family NAD(P)-binding protein [Halomicronema hongdechloris]ASC71609.1 putative NAD-dependent epimerase [Halomicronema hongdechloris C2206]